MIKQTLPDWVRWLVFVPNMDSSGNIVGMKVYYYNTLFSKDEVQKKHGYPASVVSRKDFLNEVELVLPEDSCGADAPEGVIAFGDDVPPSKYHIRNPGGKWLDFYDIWDALMARRSHLIGDSAIAHAFKKMFAPGGRDGGKDRMHDLKDMQWSINRAIEQIEQETKRIDERV